MNLLKSFSSTSCITPEKGYIYDKFFPLPFSDYIVINTQNEDQNLNYVFWNRVIQLITPFLDKENIKIIQFIEDKKFQFDHVVIDKNVSLSEKTYILKRAKFFCGSSKLYSLICSEYGVDQCFLKCDYSIDNCLTTEDQVIDSNNPRKGFLNPVGNFINNIRPEEVASFILRKLLKNVDAKFDNTICIGKIFAIPSIDLIPDCNFKIPNSQVNNEIIVRMDKFFSEENLHAQLINSPCSIVTNKAISRDILAAMKKRVKKMFFKVEKDSDSSFLSTLDSLNIGYDIITNLNSEDLSKEKIKYLHYKKVNRLNLLNLSFLDGLDKSKVYYKTNKIIIKSGQTYASRWHLKQNIPSKDIRNTDFQLPPVLDDDFREEADGFYFLTSENLES